MKKLNHVYFQATGNLKGHKVRLAADQYMPLGPTSLPEGNLDFIFMEKTCICKKNRL